MRKKSILQSDTDRCYLCSRTGPLECHHVFGASNRTHSDQDGLVVFLCRNCHTAGKKSVHQDASVAEKLKEESQKVAMKVYGWSIKEFVGRYHKNYAEEEENL